MTYTVIRLEHLSIRYGDHVVLDEVDLDVGPGVLALLGPNGAGKTTLVDVVTTLRRPDSGRVTVLGHDVVSGARAVRALIGVAGQQATVDDLLTGTENLVLAGRLLGLSRQEARRRATVLLEEFDLGSAAARRVSSWSGGMRRRLDLAASLVVTPRLLVLDEPTTGLDTRGRRALWDAVRAVAARGTAVLLTTQYLEEADALADRVVVLDEGRIVADGTPAELRDRVGADVVRVHDARGSVTAVLPTNGSAADVVRVLGAVAPTAQVSVRRPTMDEVFLHLTSRPTSPPGGPGAPGEAGAPTSTDQVSA